MHCRRGRGQEDGQDAVAAKEGGEGGEEEGEGVSNLIGSRCSRVIKSLRRVCVDSTGMRSSRVICLRKRLLRAYVWSVVLYESEDCTLRKVERDRLQAFELWCYCKMLGISWKGKVSNAGVLEQMNLVECLLVDTSIERKKSWLKQVLIVKESLVQVIIEGRMLGKRGPGRKCIHRLVDSLQQDCSYTELKHKMIEVKRKD